jgi:DNA recombination protein RmuC
MDFVVMFVPRAAALWAALAEDHSLWREAFEKNVYIADEQSLYAMLRMVKMTWRQVQQAQNQQKVFDLANEMLKRVGMFVKNMDEIGTALGKAQEAYGKGMQKLGDRGQSIVVTCRKLELLGAKQDLKNPLPAEIEGIEMQTLEDGT